MVFQEDAVHLRGHAISLRVFDPRFYYTKKHQVPSLTHYSLSANNTGLGQSMAFEMAKNGQKIVVNYIHDCEEDALATVEECKKLGGDAFAIEADCSKNDQVQNLFKKAVEHYGTVDVLINNAGVTRDNLVARMKPAEWDLVLSINLTGVFYCMQEFFKVAAENGRGGRVINMASVVGQFGNPGQANYAASKGGVIGLTKSCAREMAEYGVKVSIIDFDCAWIHTCSILFYSRMSTHSDIVCFFENKQINCICPGFIDTPMAHKLSDEQLAEVTKFIPLQRLGKPSEVAAMARFLALDEGADYITGHCFDIDGGIALAAA